MLKRLILICAILNLSACAGFEFPGVYKIAIPQGNIIDNKQLKQLKVGMSQDQVRYLLGTPLIVDTFNPDRWDYFYSKRPGRGETEHMRLTLHFQYNILASMEGDALEKLSAKAEE